MDMKNLKFRFKYKSNGIELTQLCGDKQFTISPIENCTGQEVITILCHLVNQLLEVGMESRGSVVIEDNIIYVEYYVSDEQNYLTEIKEVFMVSKLDFTRRIDVFGTTDTKELKFEFEYKSLGDNITTLISDKDFKVDLSSQFTFEGQMSILSTLIKNKLIDIGINSKGTILIDDDIIYIEYSTTQETGIFNDKKVYPISVLNFSVDDEEF